MGSDLRVRSQVAFPGFVGHISVRGPGSGDRVPSGPVEAAPLRTWPGVHPRGPELTLFFPFQLVLHRPRPRGQSAAWRGGHRGP